MSLTRLLITAVVIEKRPVPEVAATYGVSRSWLYERLARYRSEGEAVFEPRSRRPQSSPTSIPVDVVDLILELRQKLTATGLDAGPDTIGWHLERHHDAVVSRATISRYLAKHGLVVPEPKKKPKSSYIRFQAAMPNECWQSDFTHYRLTRPDGRPGADSEILTWLDDCSRYALRVSAHVRTPAPSCSPSSAEPLQNTGSRPRRSQTTPWSSPPGCPAANVAPAPATDSSTSSAGSAWSEKNSRPNHPTTCGKVERFQQTLKKWLAGQPDQPATIAELHALLDAFVNEYNHRRPHRSLDHRATPAAVYTTRPKATPGDRDGDTHNRLRRDRVDTSGKITLRYQGRLYSIGIGRTHARTRVIVLVQDLHVRVVDAAAGELIRELVLDPSKRYQPIPHPNPSH